MNRSITTALVLPARTVHGPHLCQLTNIQMTPQPSWQNTIKPILDRQLPCSEGFARMDTGSCCQGGSASGHIPRCMFFSSRVEASLLLVGSKAEKYLENLLFGLNMQLWSKTAFSEETHLLLPGLNTTQPTKSISCQKREESRAGLTGCIPSALVQTPVCISSTLARDSGKGYKKINSA